MPTFEIIAPDGKKYQVEGATAEGALAAIQKMGMPEESGPPDTFGDKFDAAVGGFVDTASFGTADEIAGALGGAFDAATGRRSFSEGYERTRDSARHMAEEDAEQRPGYRIAGQVGGALTGGAGLAKGGLSIATNVAKAGHGLGRVAAGSALDGGLYGLGHGAGSGTDADSRIRGALVGGGTGLAVGGVAPYAVAGVANAAKPLLAPIASRMNPAPYANSAMGTALARSGLSVDDIVNQLDDAQRAGQGGVFNTADAMGNSGQRMLSTVTRNPHDARQTVVDALTARQAGQGRRITNALAEGFDAPSTAAQRTQGLKVARGTAADIGYDAARAEAGMVNVSGALAAIDDVLRPGATGIATPGSNLANDSIESALTRARAWLGNGREQLTGFNEALRVKQDIDDMIGAAVRSGANNKARLLTRVRDALDESLERTSEPYAAARDAYRSGSQEIAAVETGRSAAMRGRPEDTLNAFSRMPPGEQSAFRSGYADPLIESTQTAAVGANKARPLINDATAAEFPAIAAPGRGGQMIDRIGREQRMFETNQAALGGSKTADNIADAVDMSQFDPAVWSNLLSGRPIAAAVSAVTRAIQESRGMSPRVIERVAHFLMETRPDVARQILTEAQSQVASNAGTRALATAIINNSTTAGAGRAAAGR